MMNRKFAIKALRWTAFWLGMANAVWPASVRLRYDAGRPGAHRAWGLGTSWPAIETPFRTARAAVGGVLIRRPTI
jgi:hypothetical protein